MPEFFGKNMSSDIDDRFSPRGDELQGLSSPFVVLLMSK